MFLNWKISSVFVGSNSSGVFFFEGLDFLPFFWQIPCSPIRRIRQNVQIKSLLRFIKENKKISVRDLMR